LSENIEDVSKDILNLQAKIEVNTSKINSEFVRITDLQHNLFLDSASEKFGKVSASIDNILTRMSTLKVVFRDNQIMKDLSTENESQQTRYPESEHRSSEVEDSAPSVESEHGLLFTVDRESREASERGICENRPAAGLVSEISSPECRSLMDGLRTASSGISERICRKSDDFEIPSSSGGTRVEPEGGLVLSASNGRSLMDGLIAGRSGPENCLEWQTSSSASDENSKFVEGDSDELCKKFLNQYLHRSDWNDDDWWTSHFWQSHHWHSDDCLESNLASTAARQR